MDAISGKQNPELVRRYSRGGFEQDGKQLRHSFSGFERNHLFLNQNGQQFVDVSAISGLDNIADSRGFAIWDYDRDGWQDIALVNANTPLLNVYHNEIGSLGHDENHSGGKMIAVRLLGGNRQAQTSVEFAPRDGYGALVTVSLGSLEIKREHRCGEGFAAQNSSTMIVGIGERDYAQSVTVRWPSGREQSIEHVMAGTLLTAVENSADSAEASGFRVARYVLAAPTGSDSLTQGNGPDKKQTFDLRGTAGESAALRMYTTMATWCEVCKKHLPQLEHLRSAFASEDLAMYGVPIDPIESRTDLQSYTQRYQPAYRLLLDMADDERTEFQRLVRRQIKPDVLPCALVTDERGHVLAVFRGVPTASDIGQILSELADKVADR
jgi:peroxiredoxin